MDTGRLRVEEFQIKPDTGKPRFKKKRTSENNGSINIVKMDSNDLEIDFIGIDISVINAYRRIILAEVPTMAIEKIYMYNNTSIVQDEVLAHRIGLVPLKVNPKLFEYRNKDETEWGDQDSVKYELKVKCTKDHKVSANETNPDRLYINRKILSSSLKWVPLGDQKGIFKSEDMQTLQDDILLAKMNPGHEINLEAYAVKGIGSDHAKFQPGLAYYRLLPEIELLHEVEGEDALLLQKCFSPGVIDIVTNSDGKNVAKVRNARYDSCSRNVFQHENLKDSVKLTRKTDHVIFTVESHSAFKSHEILEEAVNIMITKCNTLIDALQDFDKISVDK